MSTRAMRIGYWLVTGLFCLQMGFTAYAQLQLPEVARAFAYLGFPDYFRIGLAWAKLVGIGVLLAPLPSRLKEWAYAGFAFELAGAVLAHLAVGAGPEAWGWPAATGALWALSYASFRGLLTKPGARALRPATAV